MQLDCAALGHPGQDSAVCQVPGLWVVCLNFLDSFIQSSGEAFYYCAITLPAFPVLRGGNWAVDFAEQ